MNFFWLGIYFSVLNSDLYIIIGHQFSLNICELLVIPKIKFSWKYEKPTGIWIYKYLNPQKSALYKMHNNKCPKYEWNCGIIP